jgi:hypothetical protein
MNFLAVVWASIVAGLKHFFGVAAPALVAWMKQFGTDEGQIILADAEKYGPMIISKEITITDAFAQLTSDLAAKGLTDLEALGEIMWNALRTQANAAAPATDTATEVAPAATPATATDPAPVVAAAAAVTTATQE